MKGEVFRSIGKFLQRNGPSALSLLGCAGVIVTAVFASEEVPKVKQDLESRTMIPSKTQKVKIVASGCKKTLISGTLTCGCIIGAQAWNSRQKSQLIAGAAAIGAAYRTFKDKAREIIGEEKVQEIEDRIAGSKDIPERTAKTRKMILVWDTWLHRGIYVDDWYYALYRINGDLYHYHNALWSDLMHYANAIDANTGEKVGNMIAFENIGWNDEGFPLIESSDHYVRDANWLPLELIPNDNQELPYDYILNYGDGDYEPYDTIENKY